MTIAVFLLGVIVGALAVLAYALFDGTGLASEAERRRDGGA